MERQLTYLLYYEMVQHLRVLTPLIVHWSVCNLHINYILMSQVLLIWHLSINLFIQSFSSLNISYCHLLLLISIIIIYLCFVPRLWYCLSPPLGAPLSSIIKYTQSFSYQLLANVHLMSLSNALFWSYPKWCCIYHNYTWPGKLT